MSIKSSLLYAESWNVAYRKMPEGSILQDKEVPYNIIPNSKKYWAADPMVIEYAGRIFIFAELYDYRLCRGTIGYIEYKDNCFSKWKQIIVEDFHMSYPFLFREENDIYMIPETSESNQLLLYKAIDFPEKWKRIKTIKHGVKWVDTTIHLVEDGFIGFTEDIQGTTRDYYLRFDKQFHLLSCEEIANNSNSLRCAGRVFLINDSLIRVCQDCEKKYGSALIFRLCNSHTMEEEKNIRIAPEELEYNKKVFLDGMHTYTALSNIEVIDIKTRRLNMINLFFRLKKKLQKSIHK